MGSSRTAAVDDRACDVVAVGDQRQEPTDGAFSLAVDIGHRTPLFVVAVEMAMEIAKSAVEIMAGPSLAHVHKRCNLARARRRRRCMRNGKSLAPQGVHACAHAAERETQAPDACGEAPDPCGQAAQACGRGAEARAHRNEMGPACGARSRSRRRGRQSGCQVVAECVDFVAGEDRAAPDEVATTP
ncbi:MAG: hypothetical protein AW07_01203 [Candidatus Accumulibacter sp. SK-11]|nr:MAG: hypothetical protein AW07_01203 [Candidatus Accumulibacter sp. SK-11]